ncbi:hypothetical protein [Rhabdothermincola sp.]|uniref:hypothetical protein n=1 Tax=Rhabdothermincola sp. TaxID=2820405 RepID=UPI002FE14AC0
MSRKLTRLPVLAVLAAAAIGTAATFTVRHRSPEPSVDRFCARMAEAEGLDQSLAASDTEQVAAQVDALAAAARVAPGEIRPPIETILGITEALETSLRTAPRDPAPALAQVLQDQQTGVDQVRAAGQALQDYVVRACGLQLGETSTPVIDSGLR